MEICPTCGVIAPTARNSCEVCDGDLSGRRRATEIADERYWVGVRCHFQCRSCGHMSPLNFLDMDGSVQCHHCGLEQAFDVDSWREGLEHAHQVGDLAGPDPEGRHPHPRVSIIGANPMARVGVDQTQSTSAQAGTVTRDGMTLIRSLRVDASPGQPLCRRCQTPVETYVEGHRVTTRCPNCSTGAVCELPERAEQMCDGLAGVMADDMRVDRPQVKLDRSSGAVAMTCPNCGAGYSDVAEGKLVRCPFCQTVALIPDRFLLRYLDRKPVTATWWLLFEGRSPARRELEKPATGGEKKKPEVREAEALRPPLPMRVFTTVLIPGAILMVMMVLAYADKIFWFLPPGIRAMVPKEVADALGYLGMMP